MMETMIADTFNILKRHNWLIWNLFLATIPLLLSVLLFRWKNDSRPWFWWVILVVFIAFLPNAPYLLTDIIHLIQITRSEASIWRVTLLLIPLYVSAFLFGIEAYTISLINQGYYLAKQGAKKWIIPAEFLVHFLCAIGIFVGRFRRYNSWDLVTQPHVVMVGTLDDLTSKRPLLIMVITFVIISVTYLIMKQVTLGLILQFRYLYRQFKDPEP
ncbi:DUF1361 domain-containing protein [Lyngbya sp. CCY1209]|uniref:DUF1361 domain-containing protein n=1 Tax=Lyngbya sp. CCY1209 TaxID=2886103 RepID=UPI002D7887E2|nr:DUF1361 domain-containing protein [Lyngbya sp. CCY1209]